MGLFVSHTMVYQLEEFICLQSEDISSWSWCLPHGHPLLDLSSRSLLQLMPGVPLNLKIRFSAWCWLSSIDFASCTRSQGKGYVTLIWFRSLLWYATVSSSSSRLLWRPSWPWFPYLRLAFVSGAGVYGMKYLDLTYAGTGIPAHLQINTTYISVRYSTTPFYVSHW